MKPPRSIPILTLVTACASAASFAVAEAQVARGDAGYVVPRTEYGHPDLQGNWTNATLTPIQRPGNQGPVLTPEQVALIEGGVQELFEESQRPSDPNRPPPPAGGDTTTLPQSVFTSPFIAASGGTGGYNFVYLDPGTHVAVVNGEPRASLITIPANGRVPEVTQRVREWRAEQAARLRGFGQYDHPELRPLGERCIMSFGSNAGPPMLPNGFYNNNYTIVQTRDHVLILSELVHDARIIPLGEGPRLPAHVRPWMGDSWARWEGETLVVETTNLHPEQGYANTPSDNTRVIERFTRVAPDQILYEFRLEDPTVWVERWGGQVPMRTLQGNLYEYACHEGNYSLQNVLSGARYQERQAAEGAGRQ